MAIFANKYICFVAKPYRECFHDTVFCGIITKSDLHILDSFLSINTLQCINDMVKFGSVYIIYLLNPSHKN